MNSSETNPAASLHRLLIVDDEQLVLNGLRETLTREGYHVTTATHPFTALEALKQEIFSVIISDHQMPGVTGLEFLSQAKQLQPNASRILITAVLSLDTVIEAINQGEIYRFIVKPWLREELLATVKNAVQRYELIDHNTVLQTKAVVMNRELADANRSLELQLARVAEQNESLGQLNQALAENLQHSVQLGVHLLETFYPALGNQARRTQEMCRALADNLHLSAEKRQVLEFSAWLHDIGLVAIHRDVIRRWEVSPTALSEDELKVVQSHPILGQNLVRFGHHLEEVGTIIRAHHERFDGSGFPDGLRGEEIPWLARLLAVAATYAESALDHESTCELIKQNSGSAFDPEAVRAFLRASRHSFISRREREVLLSELQPGMVLAKGIYTPNGLLLVPEGQPLSEGAIGKILSHNRNTPIVQSLLVYC